MAIPHSRKTLIDYCLRKLGAPVIEINVDENQIDDRLDEAIQVFQEFHSDATKRIFLKHQVTATDVTNGYIPVNTDILFIKRMLPMTSVNSSTGMFDIKYQMAINDMGFLGSFAGGMAYYHQIQMHLSLIDMQLNGMPQIDFVQHEKRIYIHGEFEDQSIVEGDWIVVEATQLVDPETHTSIYNEMFIKAYTTALIKQQWGANLLKFEGMQLPGGAMLNGRQIWDDASADVDRLKEDLRLEHELPIDMMIG